MSKNLIETPVDKSLVKTSTAPPAGTKTNGEPGLPQRTTSSNGVDEVTYDRSGDKK